MESNNQNVSSEKCQITCSKKTITGEAIVCSHMSSAQFDEKGNVFWKCNLFDKKLEDDGKWLKKCEECIVNQEK